jgi:hypothetical protein
MSCLRHAQSTSPGNDSAGSAGSADAPRGRSRGRGDDGRKNDTDEGEADGSGGGGGGGGTLYEGDYGAHRRPPSADGMDEEMLAAGAKPAVSERGGGGPPDHKAPAGMSPPRGAVPRKKAPPMPAGPAPAMPRKARDVLAAAGGDGDGSSAKRPSIDALLTADNRGDAKGHSSDEDDLGTDFIKVCTHVNALVYSLFNGFF